MRTRNYFEQADPEENPHFRRRWFDPPMSAAELDRLADRELQHGHHAAADRLAWMAAALREARQ